MGTMTVPDKPSVIRHEPANKEYKIKKITFTFPGTAASENATTTFDLNGTLLAWESTGGDAAWDFTLNDGTADIFTKTGITATATMGAIVLSDGAANHLGAPISGTLKCTTANIAGGGESGTVTIYYKEE